MDGCMARWGDGWMDGWMDGWIDEVTEFQMPLNEKGKFKTVGHGSTKTQQKGIVKPDNSVQKTQGITF